MIVRMEGGNALSVGTAEVYGRDVRFLKNPTQKQAEVFAEKTLGSGLGSPERGGGDYALRYIVDENGDSYFFPALNATHHDFADSIGIARNSYEQGFIKSPKGAWATFEDPSYINRKQVIKQRKERRAKRLAEMEK
jgi:hypothetical protein